MINSLKKVIREYVPSAYPPLRSISLGAIREMRVIRGIGVRGIWSSIFRVADPWFQELPVQQVRRVSVPTEVEGNSFKDTGELLSAMGVAYASGRHAVYLSPDQWRDTTFQEMMTLYPEGTGLKLMRHPGDVETDYVTKSSSSLYKAIAYGHRHLMIVAHYLFSKGLGAQPRDLIEIQLDSRRIVGYAIEHVPNRPSASDAKAVVDNLRALVAKGDLVCVAPNGMNHEDFLPPDFGDNIRMRSGHAGSGVYIDFQNFALNRYDEFLKQVASEAIEATHFGDKSLLRGGRYLYQRIPGVALPAKRDLRLRMGTVDRLLLNVGERVADRVILDVGCNLGMAIGEYLRRGARWCYGWDLPLTIQHANRVLGAIGCTRFKLYARNLSEPVDIGRDIGSIEPGCVISYLAIRKHIGWHQSIATLPWTTMIYEGHEGEDDVQSLAYLRELGQIVEIEELHHAKQHDGARERFVAVIKRRPSS